MKRSAVAEKPSKTASGGFAGTRLVVAAVLVALVAVAPAFCVEILVILKGFLAVDNCVLSLPEVEEKIPRALRCADVQNLHAQRA